jgi:hypothetical protein
MVLSFIEQDRGAVREEEEARFGVAVEVGGD